MTRNAAQTENRPSAKPVDGEGSDLASALSHALKLRDQAETRAVAAEGALTEYKGRARQAIADEGFAIVPVELYRYAVREWIPALLRARKWAPYIGVGPYFYEHLSRAKDELTEQATLPADIDIESGEDR